MLPTTMRSEFRRFHPKGRARPNAWQPRALRLTRGRTGYTIEAKVPRRELVRMANSAIRNGPR